jgi:hypothetical protein
MSDRDLIARLAHALRVQLDGVGLYSELLAEAAARALLAEAQPVSPPEPVEPTDDMVEDLADVLGLLRGHAETGFDVRDSDLGPLVRAAIQRWGRPAPEPVSVAERLPTASDCDGWGRCWHWDPFVEHSCWVFMPPIDYPNGICTHWLPHWALPVPQEHTP